MRLITDTLKPRYLAICFCMAFPCLGADTSNLEMIRAKLMTLSQTASSTLHLLSSPYMSVPSLDVAGSEVGAMSNVAEEVQALVALSAPPVVPPPAPSVVPPPVVPVGDVLRDLAGLLGRPAATAEVEAFMTAVRTTGRANAISSVLSWEEFNRTSRFVAGLYVGLLNRNPEFSGWDFQRLALLNSVVSQEALVKNFLSSPEFRLKFGIQSPDAFVQMLYRQVLFREPSAGEVSFHVGGLAHLSRTDLAKNFLNSAEFKLGAEHRVTVFLLHACLLGRDPDQGTFTRQVEELRRGKPIATLITDTLILQR